MVVIAVNFKMAPQRDNRVKVSVLLCAGHKVREVANFAGVSRTTVLAQTLMFYIIWDGNANINTLDRGFSLSGF